MRATSARVFSPRLAGRRRAWPRPSESPLTGQNKARIGGESESSPGLTGIGLSALRRRNDVKLRGMLDFAPVNLGSCGCFLADRRPWPIGRW
ncbi:MAG: PTPA-CTERM sorting domain-containing protein [Rhodoblastus sp.]|nr:MAG: PTPA-CTERM sorting domain-containing protein [Rhodoblastus sp.]